jgi:hypothetical protein
MARRPRRVESVLLRAIAAIAVVIGAAAPSAWGAPFDFDGRDWEGTGELADLAKQELGAGRVVVTSRLDLHSLQPEDGVVVVHPTVSLDVDGLARFMKAGGRVVLFDDFGTGASLLEHFGMERVPLPEHPSAELRGNPSLAIAEPASAHPVTADVQHVVLNHATGIQAPELSPLLEVRGQSGERVLVAVAGMVDKGRLVAVGDSSIAINAMMRYGGDRAFVRNVLRYAGDDDQRANGSGHGRVFLVSGAFEQTSTFGEEPSLRTAIAARVRALEDALATIRSDGMPPGLAMAVAAIVGVGIMLWVGSNAVRVHKATQPRFTRPIPLAAQGGVAGHAAVVAGDAARPGSARLLAMLELKSALEEELCTALGLDENPGHEEIVAKVSGRGVDPSVVASLRALLLRMAQVETMMLSQRAGATMAAVRDREVLSASKEARRVVRAVQAAKVAGAT